MKRRLPALVAALKVSEAGRPVWRTCKTCGTEFNTSQYKDYCDETCYDVAGRPVEEPPEPWPTVSSLDREAAPPRKTVQDLPPKKTQAPAQSRGQQLQKRLESAASIVEDYLVTVKMIDLQIEDYRQKLEERLRVAKLEAEADTVEPVIKQMLRALKQHEATVKGVSFKLRESSTRTDVVNGEAVEKLLAKLRNLVSGNALPRFEKLAKEFFKETEVTESFRWNLSTEQEERIPKEVPPETYEEVSPEKAKSLMDVRKKIKTSLDVQSKEFAQTLRDFWNGVKSFIFNSVQPFLGFLEGAQDELEQIEQEIEAL
jgi:hypothetical protein